MIQIKDKNDLLTARSLLKQYNNLKLTNADKRRIRNFFGLLAEMEIESYVGKFQSTN